MSKKIDFLIIGAGFAGSVFANLAADAGYTVHIIDRRNHIGGNSFSYTDFDTGIEIHKYGPHIFHTNSKLIWNYLNKYSSFNNYQHQVKSKVKNNIFTLPLNQNSINKFFNKNLDAKGVKLLLDKIKLKNTKTDNFEDYLLSVIGSELYSTFYRGYTIKQWGIEPKKLQISLAKRLPIRFNKNENYFTDKFQGIPENGYSFLFRKLLDNKNIKLSLGDDYSFYGDWKVNYKNLVYTGSLDEYFNFKYGNLPYRSLTFKELREDELPGLPQLNFPDEIIPFTRITEFKYFAPNKKYFGSIGYKEYAKDADNKNELYYPIRTKESELLFRKYNNLAKKEENVIFVGRLAEYKYLNMDEVIKSSISKFYHWMSRNEK